ncbi:Ger(x)C family spore germination protein [Paenibacillus aestuarii]|uniref:Ger(X)C family spore germination protein n=1 Tax=Paenibacillus aestuarii TaxID=516965 RepID=A0ABW0K6G7_9BACL|nr:Ger(x)C family spore germination protein [Paenibacillus aestuarii]
MRKIAYSTRYGFMLAVSILLLTGCWDRREVNDLALIIATGIDLGENNQVAVTIQVFIPSPSGGSQEGNGQGNIFLLMSSGSTLSEALSELQKKLPRSFFWGHSKIYVLGEALAKRGFAEELDFLWRDVEPREESKVLIAEGSARELMKLVNEQNTIEIIVKMAKSRNLQKFTLTEVMKKTASSAKACILPRITNMVVMSGKKQSGVLSIGGFSVIKQEKMVADMDKGDFDSLNRLYNLPTYSTITIFPENKTNPITIGLKGSKFHLEPSIQGEKWKLKIKFKADGYIEQNTTTIDLFSPKDQLRRLEANVNQELSAEILKLIKHSQQRWNADILGSADSFRRHYPMEWKTVNWDERYKKLEVSVETDCRLRRAGISDLQQKMLHKKE